MLIPIIGMDQPSAMAAMRRLSLIWPDFAAPGIGADCGHVRLPNPFGGFKNAGRAHFRPHIPPTCPLFRQRSICPVRTITKSPLRISTPCAAAHFFEFVRANAVAVLQRIDTFVPGHIQKDSSADHFVFLLLDAVFLCAICIHESGIVAVPHFFRR